MTGHLSHWALMSSFKTLISFAGLTLALAVLPLTLSAQNEEAEPASEAEMFRQFGYMISQNFERLSLDEAEQAAFLDGMRAGLSGETLMTDEEMAAANQRIQMALRERMMGQQDRQNAEFLAGLDDNPDITKAESGLYYEIIEPGEGEKATAEDEVRLHYTGTLVDGTVFDSSHQRGEPATFPVNRVVPGFSEGVQLVAPGGRIKLYIPPELGYGDQAPGQIPPRSVLIFDVEMLEVLAATEEAAGPEPEPVEAAE